MVRSTLLKLSESKKFAKWVTTNPSTRRMSHRFVAGEELDEALAAAKVCNELGMLVSLDYLGENVSTIADAQHSRDAYLEVFEKIAAQRINANVSCKLTALGLDLSTEFCEGLVLSIVERAAAFDNFLRVDMEGSLYTQRTIDLVKRVRSQSPAIGTVIQAYLYRSEKDVQDWLPDPAVQGRVQGIAGSGIRAKSRRGRELCAPDANVVAERVLSRDCHTRPEDDWSDDSLCCRKENFEGRF